MLAQMPQHFARCSLDNGRLKGRLGMFHSWPSNSGVVDLSRSKVSHQHFQIKGNFPITSNLRGRASGQGGFMPVQQYNRLFLHSKDGGTQSIPLQHLLYDILLWCIKRDMVLRAVYLPGIDISIIDLLSHFPVNERKWLLPQFMVDCLFNQFSNPFIDLFGQPGQLQTVSSQSRLLQEVV